MTKAQKQNAKISAKANQVIEKSGKKSNGLSLLDTSVCLVVTCAQLGNTRMVARDTVKMSDKKTKEELTEEKNEISIRKSLLSNSALQPIRYAMWAAKMYLRSVAVASHRVLGPGAFIVPLKMVERVETRLGEFKAEIDGLVDTLVVQYAAAVQERKKALGPLFDPHDYHSSAESVRAEFQFDWNYVSFETPGKLTSVSQALASAVREKFEARMATAFDEYQVGVRQLALEVTSAVLDRLTPGPDGKTKNLRGTALKDLTELFANLPNMDVTNDAALKTAMDRLHKAAKGVDVQMLKDDDVLKKRVTSAVADAKKALSALVETSAGRAIAFGGLKA